MNSQTELRIKCSKDSYGFWYREHHWRWVDGEALDDDDEYSPADKDRRMA